MKAKAARRRAAARWIARPFAGLGLVLGALYVWRPDGAAALTLVPPLLWAAFGLLASALATRLDGRVGPLLIGWLAFALVVPEEPASLLRWGPRIAGPARTPGTELRVVSLNCGVGNALAAAEAAAYAPDLILLQEAPSRAACERLLARELTGFFLAHHGDAAVLSRLPLEQVRLDPASGNMAAAKVTLPGGQRLAVGSVRLTPPVWRLDLWNPQCWRIQAEDRRLRRGELQRVRDALSQVQRTENALLGGDFNAPARDAVYRELRGKLKDAHAEAGRGLGNTVINDFPFARIDQVWVSHGLRALAHASIKTRHSDHRMVVVDLRLPGAPRRGAS